jgi:hypothetical protein
MAVDRGYGSGKSRSAANSAARRDKAASANLRKKNIKKVASKPFQKQALASVGKQAAAGFNIGGRQYLETGVSANKLASVLKGVMGAGDKYSMAQKLALRSRLSAKLEGQRMTGNVNDVRMREQSTSIFPRIGSIKTRTAPNRILEEQGRRRYNEMDKFNDYMSGYPTSKAQARAALRNSNKPRAK